MSYGTEDHKHNSYDVYGVAEEHHRHYDLENDTERARGDLDSARGDLDSLRNHVSDLEERLGEAFAEIRDLQTRLADQGATR